MNLSVSFTGHTRTLLVNMPRYPGVVLFDHFDVWNLMFHYTIGIPYCSAWFVPRSKTHGDQASGWIRDPEKVISDDFLRLLVEHPYCTLPIQLCIPHPQKRYRSELIHAMQGRTYDNWHGTHRAWSRLRLCH